MSRRVSIKGQGTDIFFEGLPEAPGKTPSAAHEPWSPTPPAGLPDSKTARQTAGKTARQEEGQTASPQDMKTDVKRRSLTQELAGTVSGETKRRLRSLLRLEHRVHNTFRYTPEELAAVRDIVYEMEVRWGRKVTRNDVMRAALNWIIEDFNERQEESFLAQLSEEEE